MAVVAEGPKVPEQAPYASASDTPVRHEVARVFIREIEDPVFCHRYPTGPCVGGNPGVRSARDTVASA